MDTINCIGAYGNMLMIFKELSKRIRTKIGNARKTDGIITLEDIGTVLKDFEDFMNNNLAQYNKEVKIDFTDNVPQQDPNDVPFEITNLQNNNESKNMNKKLIRLTESDLHRIVKESVDKILMEAQSEDASESIDENNTNEGFMGDMWNGIKRGAYQMTHRPEAMSDYDKRNSNSQRMRNNYANQQRQGVINRGIAKEKGLDMASRNRRKMINQREGFSN